MPENIPPFIRSIKRALHGDVYVIVVIILVGGASFGLGRLSTIEEHRDPVLIEQAAERSGAQQAAVMESDSARSGGGVPDATVSGQYVASRNSDKYHYPWCPGAARIKEENKIWFDSKAEAERAGYSPAANCKGLE